MAAMMKRLMLFSPPPPPHHLLSPIARRFSTRPSSISTEAKEGFEPKLVLPPEELWKNVVKLTCDSTAKGGVCHVYLVGTINISKKSCQKVQAVIDFLKPQALFLGLSPSLVSLLRLPQTLEVPKMAKLIRTCIATRNPSKVLHYWYAVELSQKVGVFPGAVFGVAFRAAAKYTKTTILGDRPSEITWARAKMRLWHKIKLPFQFLKILLETDLPLGSGTEDATWLKAVEVIEDLDEDELNLIIQAMAKHLPTFMETFVFERDRYMSAKLLELAKEHNVVVAVVGRHHLQGIQENWGRHVVLEDLLTVPSQKKTADKILLSDIAVNAAVIATMSYFVINLGF